jgi:hypothetical protein
MVVIRKENFGPLLEYLKNVHARSNEKWYHFQGEGGA